MYWLNIPYYCVKSSIRLLTSWFIFLYLCPLAGGIWSLISAAMICYVLRGSVMYERSAISGCTMVPNRQCHVWDPVDRMRTLWVLQVRWYEEGVGRKEMRFWVLDKLKGLSQLHNWKHFNSPILTYWMLNTSVNKHAQSLCLHVLCV